MKDFFDYYASLELQRVMVSDKPRTDAFCAAVRELVHPGCAFLDVGTGTGLLAMTAAKSGASKVFAIDQTAVVKQASKLAKANGLKVRFFQGPAEELELDEKVDVLASEWLGNLAFVEDMLPAVLACRDKHLKEGGVMLPSAVRLFLAPFSDPVSYHQWGPGFWRQSVQSLDFSLLESTELAQAKVVQTQMNEGAIVAPPTLLEDFDMMRMRPEDAFFSRELEFVLARDAVIHGFVGWFDLQLSPSQCLSTSPFAAPTHWAQSVFFVEPVARAEGDRLLVSVRLDKNAEDPRHLDVELGFEGQSRMYVVE